MIISKNIMIRCMEEKDILVEHIGHQKTCFLEDNTMKSLMQLKKEYEENIMHQNHKKFMICTKDGEEVGVIEYRNYNPRHSHVEICIIIWEEKNQNKGYGKEAVDLFVKYLTNEMHIHRIEAKIEEGNIKALHIFETIGFQREGLLRKYFFYGGKYHDYIILSKLYFQ